MKLLVTREEKEQMDRAVFNVSGPQLAVENRPMAQISQVVIDLPGFTRRVVQVEVEEES